MAITDYFVSPANGSDSTGNGTLGNPWKTTQHALNTITRNTNGGDRVNIQHGSPDILTATLSLTTYGTPAFGAPLVFQGYTSAQGDGGIGDVSGNGLYGILTSQPSYTTFKDLHLHNCGANQILSLSAECLVEDCELDTSTANPGISATGSLTTVRNNDIHDCTAVALDAQNAVSNLVSAGAGSCVAGIRVRNIGRDNRVLCTGAMNGLLVDLCADARNNSIYSAGGSGAGISAESGNSLSDVIDNIVEGFSGVGGLGIGDSSNHTIRMLCSNRVYNCTTAYSLPNTPLFNDGNNLTLTASPFNSPSTGDLSLNSNPNGGALCAGTYSYPSGFQGGARTQWRVIGAIQPAPPTNAPPNTPTLTVADNGNGTGATATISGSSAGSSNTVEVSKIGVDGALTQTAFGPRTGDGTVALSLSDGPYVATVTSSLNGLYAAPCDPYGFNASGTGTFAISPRRVTIVKRSK